MVQARRPFKPGPGSPMSGTIAIVTPAFRAEAWIAGCAESVLAQTYPDWEHWIVSDDGVDYERLLAGRGLLDPRQRFVTTGQTGSGASRTRNIGLDQIEAPYAATLDADDRFKPQKLERTVEALEHHAIVSMAIEELTPEGTRLRLVGEGPDRALDPAGYKWVNLSMDSMIAWDRRKTDARFDPSLANMNDLDFLLRLFERAQRTWHIGTPLHDYLKLPQSLSNGAGVTERMIAAKREMLRRLEAGLYPMRDPGGAEGMAKFLRISLSAEETYPAALAARPGLLFEDHIEPMLTASI
jgi:glycosyltransferase involved in cell wall biosynthesis